VEGALTGNADTVTTNASLTGHVTSTGNATLLGSFTVAQLSTAISDATLSGNNTGDQTSITGNAGTVTDGVYTTDNLSVMAETTSAQLAGVISDETGTGLLVFSDTPTIDTPVLNSPKIVDTIFDTNGAEILRLNKNGSAVNYLETRNSATGQPVEVNAKGDDANIDLELNRKGTGSILLGTRVKVRTNNITTSTGALNIDATTTVYFNSSKSNRDLRVNGNTVSDLIFCDGSADSVGFGTDAAAPRHRVDIRTGMGYQALVKTASYSVADTDRVLYCDATNNSVTITLPTPVIGRVLEIYRKDNVFAYSVSVVRSASPETINGLTSLSISDRYSGWRIICVEDDIWIAHYQTPSSA